MLWIASSSHTGLNRRPGNSVANPAHQTSVHRFGNDIFGAEAQRVFIANIEH
jgi:hypothetical protein